MTRCWSRFSGKDRCSPGPDGAGTRRQLDPDLADLPLISAEAPPPAGRAVEDSRGGGGVISDSSCASSSQDEDKVSRQVVLRCTQPDACCWTLRRSLVSEDQDLDQPRTTTSCCSEHRHSSATDPKNVAGASIVPGHSSCRDQEVAVTMATD